MELEIILDNIIVENRRSGFDSVLFQEAENVVGRGFCIASNGEQRQLVWNSREKLYDALEVPLSDME